MRPPISLVLLLFPMRRRELSRKQAEGPERAERNMKIEHHTAKCRAFRLRCVMLDLHVAFSSLRTLGLLARKFPTPHWKQQQH